MTGNTESAKNAIGQDSQVGFAKGKTKNPVNLVNPVENKIAYIMSYCENSNGCCE